MADAAKVVSTTDKAEGKTSTTQNEAGSPPPASPEVVMVMKSSDKKKKKKRYSSKGMRAIQELMVINARAKRRRAKVQEKVLTAWLDASDKSARKKKNGVLKDSKKNGLRALRKSIVGKSRARASQWNDILKLKIFQ